MLLLDASNVDASTLPLALPLMLPSVAADVAKPHRRLQAQAVPRCLKAKARAAVEPLPRPAQCFVYFCCAVVIAKKQLQLQL